MKIDCKSSVTAERDSYLTAEEVAAWIADIPSDAQVLPILHEIGSQRDPVTVLAGLIAKWVEER